MSTSDVVSVSDNEGREEAEESDASGSDASGVIHLPPLSQQEEMDLLGEETEPELHQGDTSSSESDSEEVVEVPSPGAEAISGGITEDISGDISGNVPEAEVEASSDPVNATPAVDENQPIDVSVVAQDTVSDMEVGATSPERRLETEESDQLFQQTSPERAVREKEPVRKEDETESAKAGLAEGGPEAPSLRKPRLRRAGRDPR